MKKVIASILLLAFFAHTFNQAFYYMDYLVNKAAYVQKCVNKARPQLHCNGQCALMKKIKEKEQRDQQNSPELKLVLKTEVLSSKSYFGSLPFIATQHTIRHYEKNESKPIDRTHAVFHPPQA